MKSLRPGVGSGEAGTSKNKSTWSSVIHKKCTLDTFDLSCTFDNFNFDSTLQCTFDTFIYWHNRGNLNQYQALHGAAQKVEGRRHELLKVNKCLTYLFLSTRLQCWGKGEGWSGAEKGKTFVDFRPNFPNGSTSGTTDWASALTRRKFKQRRKVLGAKLSWRTCGVYRASMIHVHTYQKSTKTSRGLGALWPYVPWPNWK